MDSVRTKLSELLDECTAAAGDAENALGDLRDALTRAGEAEKALRAHAKQMARLIGPGNKPFFPAEDMAALHMFADHAASRTRQLCANNLLVTRAVLKTDTAAEQPVAGTITKHAGRIRERFSITKGAKPEGEE